MIIRVLLIGGVIAGVVLILRGTGSHRQLAIRRLAVIAFAAASIVAVIVPSSVTTLAHAVGVGRGTDLLLYTLVIAVLLGAVGINQRISRLEERLVRVTRELAIDRAAPGDRGRDRREDGSDDHVHERPDDGAEDDVPRRHG